MTDEFKSCPFCGSADVELRESITDEQITCCHCGARSGLIYLGASDAVNAANRRVLVSAWNTRAAPPARTYAEGVEDAAVDAAISAIGWTDERMIADARKIAAGVWFETYGFGGDCCLTGPQVTSFRSCLDGASAAIRLLSQGEEA